MLYKLLKFNIPKAKLRAYALSLRFPHVLISLCVTPILLDDDDGLLRHVQLFVNPWTAACQVLLSSTIFQSLLKFLAIELVMLSNHLILCYPLLLLPSIFPSLRVFSNELALCIRSLTYWSFSFNISPCNEYLGLISFRIDWLDLLAVQGAYNYEDPKGPEVSIWISLLLEDTSFSTPFLGV